MKGGDLVSTAVSNTFRSKLRTLLTVLAIFVGAFTLTLTNALGAGISDYVDRQVAATGADDMMFITTMPDTSTGDTDAPERYDPAMSSASSGGMDPLDKQDLATIKDTDGILKASPLRIVMPNFISYNGGDNWELETNIAGPIAKADLEAGAQLDRDTDKHQIIIPTTYLDPMKLGSAQDAVGKTVSIGIKDAVGDEHILDAEVVGVARESLTAKGASMNTPLLSALADKREEGVKNPDTSYPMVIAYFDIDATEEEITAIKDDLREEGYLAQTTADQLGMIQTVITGLIGVLNGFAVIALLAASFGIINTLLMSVQERTREIGLMKAMGMGGKRIFTLFALEAIFIGFLGAAIGSGAGIAVGTTLSNFLANGMLSGLPGLQIMLFTPANVITVIVLIMVIAFLSGTLPARKAAKQDPIDALRYE